MPTPTEELDNLNETMAVALWISRYVVLESQEYPLSPSLRQSMGMLIEVMEELEGRIDHLRQQASSSKGSAM